MRSASHGTSPQFDPPPCHHRVPNLPFSVAAHCLLWPTLLRPLSSSSLCSIHHAYENKQALSIIPLYHIYRNSPPPFPPSFFSRVPVHHLHRNTASADEQAVSLTGATVSQITPLLQNENTAQWTCAGCTFENHCALPSCELCELPRPSGDPWMVPKKRRRRHHLPRLNDPPLRNQAESHCRPCLLYTSDAADE